MVPIELVRDHAVTAPALDVWHRAPASASHQTAFVEQPSLMRHYENPLRLQSANPLGRRTHTPQLRLLTLVLCSDTTWPLQGDHPRCLWSPAFLPRLVGAPGYTR